jgi:ferritin
MPLFDYLLERGGRVKLTEIEKPASSWKSPLAAFEDAFKHEQYMTQRINALAQLSLQEDDFATNNVMQWYISEQVEEEANVDAIVQQLKLVGDNGPGIFMIDRELKQRAAVTSLDPGA